MPVTDAESPELATFWKRSNTNVTLRKSDFTIDDLQALELSAGQISEDLRDAANELQQGFVGRNVQEASKSLKTFLDQFCAVRDAMRPDSQSLQDLREAFEHQGGRAVLQLALRIRSKAGVNLEEFQAIVVAELETEIPDSKSVAAARSLLSLIQEPEMDFQAQLSSDERAGQVFPRYIVVAALSGRLYLAEPDPEQHETPEPSSTDAQTEPEIELSSQQGSKPTSTDDDDSPLPTPLPAPKKIVISPEDIAAFKKSRKDRKQPDPAPSPQISSPEKSDEATSAERKAPAGTGTQDVSAPQKQQSGSASEKRGAEEISDSASIPPDGPSIGQQDGEDRQEMGDNVSVDPQLQARIWETIARQNVSLAYHTAKHFQLKDPDLTALRLALLGRNILNASGDLQGAFVDELSHDPPVEEWDSANAILALSGLLPAALADTAGASLALSAINRLSLPTELHGLRHELTQLASNMRGRSFLEGLQLAQEYLEWLNEEDRLKNRLQDELQTAPLRSVSFAPATKVWQSFWHPGGMLEKVVAPAANSLRGPVKTQTMTLEEIDQAVQASYQAQHNKKNKTIHTGALRQLQTKVQEALELVQEFANHRASEPSIDHHLRGVVQFVQQWADVRPIVINSADTYSPTEQAALAWLDSRLEALTETIGGRSESKRHLLKDTVGRALLRSNIPMDEAGEALPGADLGQSLLTALKQNSSWAEALEGYLETGDLENAWLVIGEMDEPHDTFELRWQENVEQQRASLQRLMEQVRQLFDVSSYQGLLTESEIQRYEQRLTEMRRLSSDGAGRVNFGALRKEALDKLGELELAFTRRVETLRKRLSALTLNSEVIRRIEQKLDEKDVQTAQEYLGYAERNETLPDIADDSAAQFTQFFPSMLEAIDHYLVSNRPEKVIGDLKARSGRYVPDVTTLPQAQVSSAIALLTAWYEAKRVPAQFGPGAVRRIFDGLGFTLQRTEPHKISGSNPTAWQVETVPVADRAIIPVENYGSRAEGHYRVIPVWERPSEESVINMIGTSPLPTFILYFGRLSQQRRRDLAVMARERRKIVVVIDELLVMALTGIRGSRLPVLFRLGMPFSAFEPYTVTGSIVSPEMFFGREQEINDILDPRGASFLYGGRQLGKSALLRHVERMHHEPKAGTLVRWVDLKSKEVGHGQEADYLWTVLMRELQTFGVFSANFSNPKPEQFQKAVKKWLDEDSTRRILLLLDEADQFLKLDGEKLINGIPAYTNASHLKNLMETTDRRFKVVFAGTHNVLKAHRSSTSTNSPLVHLGHPIEIGPMLETRERRQAYALVTEPFALQGYRFEPSDLPYRILARTNYYPSLIQIYGHHLMRYLQEGRTQLPFTIRSEHVDGVFRDRELAKDIRDRLLWTLRLDINGRYEATAYALAEAAASGQVNLEVGVSNDQLYQLASYWLPDGFAQTDRQEMRSVVEEMKGLGILRETQPEIYTFRTPNVALMLGSSKEIESALMDLQERHSRQAELGPVSRRSVLPQHPTHAAPLTSKQLFELIGNQNGLKVVVSTTATNGHLLKQFLVENIGQSNVIEVPVLTDLAGFKQYLDREMSKRDSHQLYLVSSNVPWTPDWVKAVKEKFKRLKDKSVTRFVFHGGPNVLQDQADLADDLIIGSPWNTYELHSWLESQGYQSDIDTCRAIERVTGNWPANIQAIFEQAQHKGLQEALKSAASAFENSTWLEQRKSDLGLDGRKLEMLSVLTQAGDDIIESAESLLDLADHSQNWDVQGLQETLDTSVKLQIVDYEDGTYRTSPYLKNLLS